MRIDECRAIRARRQTELASTAAKMLDRMRRDGALWSGVIKRVNVRLE